MKWFGFVLPVTLYLCAAAQTGKPAVAPQKPLRSDPGTLASVEGTVLNSLTGKPLDGVHVKFVAYDSENTPVAAYGAMTNSAGHFSILAIQSNNYLVFLEREGFIFVPGAQKGSHGTLRLTTGDHIRDLALQMVPRSIISGRVLDEYGDPVMDARVFAIPASPQPDLGFVPQFTTNDRGEFRLIVPPGKYYVTASLRSRSLRPIGTSEIRTDGTADGDYLETYYPAATTTEAATVVATKAGRELSGVDITLARSPALTIRGTVSGAPEGCSLAVHANGENGPMHGVGVTPPESAASDDAAAQNEFQIGRLTSGVYGVYAQCTSGDTEWFSGILELTLTDSNIEGINLVLAPGADITGAIVVQGKPAKSSEESWTITLHPMGRDDFNLRRTAEAEPDGTFVIKGVYPQRYSVQVSPLAENSYIKTVGVNDVSAADGIVDFSGGADGARLKITLGLNGAHLNGHVEYPDGEPAPLVSVLLFPDREDFGSHEVQQARSGIDGQYSFKGLAPGRYKLLPMKISTDARNFHFPRDMAVYRNILKDEAAKADSIEIKEGEDLHKDLKWGKSEEDHAGQE